MPLPKLGDEERPMYDNAIECPSVDTCTFEIGTYDRRRDVYKLSVLTVRLSAGTTASGS